MTPLKSRAEKLAKDVIIKSELMLCPDLTDACEACESVVNAIESAFAKVAAEARLAALTNRMGDYYVGSRYLCTNCSGVSYLDHCNKTPSDNELFMIEQLVSGKTKTPTTPIGN